MYAGGEAVAESYILIGQKSEQRWAWHELLRPQNPTVSSNKTVPTPKRQHIPVILILLNSATPR